MVMEGLNRLFALADSRQLLKPLHPKITDRTFMYVDDVVLFLTPHQQDLLLSKLILSIFAGASGLKTNPDKCLISPIQCDLEATVTLLQYFHGRVDHSHHILGHSTWAEKIK